jgi:hypothetical protein
MQRDAVRSIELELRMFAQSAQAIQPGLDHEAIREALAACDWSDREQGLRDLIRLLLVDPDQFKIPWSVAKFTQSGNKTRYDDGRTIEVFDGADPIRGLFRKGISQVEIGSTPDGFAPRRQSLSDLRWTPGDELDAARIELVTPDTPVRADEICCVWLPSTTGSAVGRGEIVADVASGLPKSFKLYDASGGLRISGIQAELEIHDGVAVPGVSIRLTYQQDRLDFVQIAAMVGARVNQEVPETVFAVGAPTGSVAIDHRTGRREHAKIKQDVPDVKRYLGDPVPDGFPGSRPIQPSAPTTPWVIIGLANAAIVALISLIWHARKRQ